MSMEIDFRAILASNAGVLAVVGNNPGPKPATGPSIYPSTYATGCAPPAIRYAKVTGAPGLHMGGTDGLSVDLMQIDVRALTAASAFAVKDAVISKLHAFTGVQGTTDFRLIALRDDRGVQFETTGQENFYTASLDFDVISRAA